MVIYIGNSKKSIHGILKLIRDQKKTLHGRLLQQNQEPSHTHKALFRRCNLKMPHSQHNPQNYLRSLMKYVKS